MMYLFRPSIADVQSFVPYQVARPGAALGHCMLIFDPRPMRAERSLRIGILVDLFPPAPLRDVHMRSDTSASAAWIFELRLL